MLEEADMDFADLTRRRHSVRRYLARPVEREKLETCLEAARLAPSATNAQPWRFVVVDEPSVLTKLGEAAFGGIYRMDFARQAPVIVAVVMDASPRAQAGGWLRRTPFALLDLGIAGEHFVLQATELGLGCCWIGWFNERGVKSVLGIPARKRVPYLLSLGYPAGETPGLHLRRAAAEIASFNHWGKAF
jgi:nitroreductase